MLDIRTRIRIDLNPSKRIRFRIRSENIHTVFIPTEEKKTESFKRGLGTKLMKTMANSKCTTYNEFISDALT